MGMTHNSLFGCSTMSMDTLRGAQNWMDPAGDLDWSPQSPSHSARCAAALLPSPWPPPLAAPLAPRLSAN